MGWNDHMDDDELGNLPPEAFSPWNVDGPFDPQDHWLETATRDEQMIAMRGWFSQRYCDPSHNTPYDGREGGFQFIDGGPYDPADVLFSRFARVVDSEVIQELVDELHQQVGDEWAPIPLRDPNDYDEDYGVVVEESRQPLDNLRKRLDQSKEVLILKGGYSAQLLARKLAFGFAISALESFLWETVVYWVDHDEEVIARMVMKMPVFREREMKLGQIFERRENLRDEIKAHLQHVVWHRWDQVVPLFKVGLDIEIGSVKPFGDALKKRHDIVHRSGLTKSGETVDVEIKEIGDLCELILRFATEIDRNLARRKSELEDTISGSSPH